MIDFILVIIISLIVFLAIRQLLKYKTKCSRCPVNNKCNIKQDD